MPYDNTGSFVILVRLIFFEKKMISKRCKGKNRRGVRNMRKTCGRYFGDIADLFL